MSLVNKMLQDLNARNAQEVVNHLPEQVRVMSAQAGSGWSQHRRRVLGALLALALLAIAAWQWGGMKFTAPGGDAPAAPVMLAAEPAAAGVPATLEAQPADDGAAALESQAPEHAQMTAHPVDGREVPPLAEALPPLPSTLAALPAAQPAPRQAARAAPAGNLQLRVAESLSMLSRLASQKTAPAATTTSAAAAQARRQPEDGAPAPDSASRPTEAGPAATRKPAQAAAETRQDAAQPASQLATASAPAAVKVQRVDRSEQPDERLQRALTAYHQGRLDEAVDKLRDILAAQPRQVDARQALLSIQVERRQYADAMQLLTEGLAVLPARSDWAMALARLQVDAGSIQAALATLQTHQAQAQGNADYLGFMGVLQQHLQLHREAVQSYQAALRLKPREGRWWYALGMSLEAVQQVDAAREAFTRARSAGGLTSAMHEAIARRLQVP